MIKCMDKELKLGQMDQDSKDFISILKNKVEDITCGQINQIMMVIGKTIK